MIDTAIAEAINAFFEGIRSLGVAGHGGVFVAGWAFGWVFGWGILYVRRKLKIG